MENKKFIILRYVIIILTCLGLIGIEIYQNKNKSVVVDENPAITKAREYVSNNRIFINSNITIFLLIYFNAYYTYTS